MTHDFAIDSHLEDQYNNMARRPDASEVLQQIMDRSASYRQQADALLDCVYGAHERQRVDLFHCGNRNAALFVYLHGGYWQRGDKSMYSYLAEAFNAAGVDMAVVGYPLCPEVSMTELVSSVRQALGWLWRNAASLGVCAERINLSGHSAGGHLTAMGLSTDWPAVDTGLPRELIKSGVAISGLYRLDPLLPTSISQALHLSDEEVSGLSPINQVAATDAPVLVVVGGGESDAFHTQADDFIAGWSRPGLNLDKHIEPGADHFDVIVNLGDSESEIFKRSLAWLR